MELSNTLTVAQLAFGINAVLGFMLTRYFNEINRFHEVGSHFIGQHKMQEVTFEIEESDIFKALESVLPDFRMTSKVYIFGMFYAFACVLISFVVLICASLYPTVEINLPMFLVVSVVLLLINPCFYYIVDHRYRVEFEHARSLLEHAKQYSSEAKELQPFISLICWESFKRKYGHNW